MTATAGADRRLRARRPPKPGVDPWRPIDVVLEPERQADGRVAPALTVFLAGAECPFTCVYCDLWRHTLDAPTPPGAIPAQLRQALDRFPPTPGTVVKLYNASNLFDARAVPPEDDDEILRLAEPFARVVVECHPRLVRRRALDWARRLDGRLQVAMGLETVHPQALPRLNKKLTLDDFDRAAATLRENGAGVRVFVLAAAPYVPADESVDWTVRSVEHALMQGAEHVAIIPLRDNGEDFREPALEELEDAYDRSLALRPAGTAEDSQGIHSLDSGRRVTHGRLPHADPGIEIPGYPPASQGTPGAPIRPVVTVDLWDLERFADCPACFDARRARLERMNLGGRREPRIACECRA